MELKNDDSCAKYTKTVPYQDQDFRKIKTKMLYLHLAFKSLNYKAAIE